MKKLNSVIYNKLILQAEEAKEQNMIKLADAVLGSLTATPENEDVKYNFSNMKDDVYQELWKTATNVLKYYDLKSVDAEKINETIEILANHFIEELEHTLNISKGTIGPLEEPVLGQK